MKLVVGLTLLAAVVVLVQLAGSTVEAGLGHQRLCPRFDKDRAGCEKCCATKRMEMEPGDMTMGRGCYCRKKNFTKEREGDWMEFRKFRY